MEDGKCIFCGKDVESNGGENKIYKCKGCGNYYISDNFRLMSRKFESEIINNLYSKFATFLYYNKKEHLVYFIGEEKDYQKYIKNHKDSQMILLSKEIVDNWYPKTFAEKIDKILMRIYEDTNYLGNEVVYEDKDILKLFFVKNFYKNNSKEIMNLLEENEVKYIVEYLINCNYIHAELKPFCNSTTIKLSIILKPKGLARVEELQKNNINNKDVFIAMKFGKDTKLLRGKIKEGIKKAGYIPKIMDEIEHNHQIVPEMLYTIRNSRFVIAELSDDNNGAYYEAGYALGVGKEVIHICNAKVMSHNKDEEKDEVKNPKIHFDVAQINTIIYDNINEIPDKLAQRIIATITDKEKNK